MAKITVKAISALHFNETKVFILDSAREVDTARTTLGRWKNYNPGWDYKTKTQKADGKILMFLTLYDHIIS